MDLTQLLHYQEEDAKLFSIEQKLVSSPHKKRANELAGLAKKAQVKSTELENEANNILKEIEDLKNNFAQSKKSLDGLLKKDLDKFSEEELDASSTLKGKILNNLNSLEKMLQKSAEKINNVLSEYNKTKKMYDNARVQFEDCKRKMQEESTILEPEKEKLQKKLVELEKNVDKKLMEEYKKRRNDNIFPVVVPLEGKNFCGRCRMELPMVAISRINETGVITCEHCKRLIYKK